LGGGKVDSVFFLNFSRRFHRCAIHCVVHEPTTCQRLDSFWILSFSCSSTCLLASLGLPFDLKPLDCFELTLLSHYLWYSDIVWSLWLKKDIANNIVCSKIAFICPCQTFLTGLNNRVVSASDCSVRGPRFESRRWQLCLSRQLLWYTVLSTGCAPLLQCLGRLSLPPFVGR